MIARHGLPLVFTLVVAGAVHAQTGGIPPAQTTPSAAPPDAIAPAPASTAPVPGAATPAHTPAADPTNEHRPDDPVAALAVATPRPGVPLFYFFSPDWRPPDFSKLAVSVEKALANGQLEVSFQAFTRYEDFERQVRAQPPTFMIAPAWLANPDAGTLGAPYAVVARPLRLGRSSYRKALMTRSNADSIDDLARASIAATLHSMGSGEPSAVLDTFHLASGSARIVPVPKDIDALLALSFGQVDAALVTSEQYEQLARTSPAEAERLRVIAFSSEVELPPVFVAVSADDTLRTRLKDILARFPDVPGGRDVLAMLGFDAFVAEAPAADAGPGAPAGGEADVSAEAGAAAGDPRRAVAKPASPAKKKPAAGRRRDE